MTENDLKLLSEAQTYVSNLFRTKNTKSIRFHNLEHTQGVVIAAEEMADYYQLQDEDRVALALGAWFHDSGFTSGDAEGHENRGIQIASRFLQEQGVDQALINKVRSAIEATRLPQTPKNLLEQILCDADLYHLGTDDFSDRSKLLREELSELSKKDFSKKEWRKLNINFLENHKYFTEYARRKLQPVKERNLQRLISKEEESKADKKEKVEKAVLGPLAESPKEEPKKKLKEEKSERGIQTVFRIMAQNHANLSQMADAKANILVSVNSIILTIIISVLLSKLESNRNLVIPTIILLVVCVSAIVFSILATRPNVSSGKFTKENIQNKETNLLFFGNFHKMSLPDYDWAMSEMLNDKEYLYSSMIKDIYFLGVVLARKYRYLRISFSIFMYGLIVAVLAFAAALAFPQASAGYAP
ncbi:MAG TPA: Pycsar system effector family protein [Chitinophagaceae bacterium]|nr:Pycsar system effector family protein [Chitinophagaceae bacterium]